MPGDVAATRAKVQQYLTQNFGDVNVDSNGNYSLRKGSTRMFVSIRTHDDGDWTWVTLQIPILLNVEETPAVFEHVALHGDDYIFGHLSANRTDDGLIIMFTHALLGDFLDEEELARAVGGMLYVADEIDDELEKQFGGIRFHEE